MRRRRKKQRPEQGGDDDKETVQTVYGDLVTFMMMLFVLLFVMSYNKNQSADFMTELQVRFGENQDVQQQSPSTDSLLVSKIEHYIQENDLEDVTKVVVDEHRVKLILEAPILFESGKAVLRPSATPIIKGVSDLFKDVLNPLVIEGHTDNIPINTPKFESNWELSFHRGYSVVKYLISKGGYKPSRLSVLGYGEYRPLLPNDSALNRAKNRRIEISVIRVRKKEDLPQ